MIEQTAVYEAIGWVALSLNVAGNFALAKKSVKGWLIRLACNIAFIAYSYAFDIWPLLINHIIFMGVNAYGWTLWSRDTYTCSCGRRYENPKRGEVCACELPLELDKIRSA